MPLEPKTDSTHVSIFQFPLYSQLADFGLLCDFLINGVDRRPAILGDVHDLALNVIEVPHLLH